MKRREIGSSLESLQREVDRILLYKQLPRDPQEPHVEFNDELALQYYRIEKINEGRIELNSKGGKVAGPTATGTRSQDDEVRLSTIVDKMNEVLGTDFTAADQLFLDQLKEDALEGDHLRRSAQVNSEENFALEFDDTLTDLFIDRMDQNQELFARFMDNEDVQRILTEQLRQEVYQVSQESGA